MGDIVTSTGVVFDPTNPSVVFYHNLASHIHANPIAKEAVSRVCKTYVRELLHYSRIGSKYCPRVLLMCERIVKTMVLNNVVQEYKEFLIEPDPRGFD